MDGLARDASARLLNAIGSLIYKEGRFIGSEVSQRVRLGNLLDNQPAI